jgi:hypothetical protein
MDSQQPALLLLLPLYHEPHHLHHCLRQQLLLRLLLHQHRHCWQPLIAPAPGWRVLLERQWPPTHSGVLPAHCRLHCRALVRTAARLLLLLQGCHCCRYLPALAARPPLA